MKKTLIAIIVCSFCFTACASDYPEMKTEEAFETIYTGHGTYGDYSIVYYKDNGVMYVVTGVYSGQVFTLLVNPDGTPMTIEGE